MPAKNQHPFHRFACALLLSAGSFFLTVRAADGRIPISAVPYTISAPGHYYLTQDLTLASGTAIQINSGQVTLDLGGHTLTNSATTSGNYGINSTGGYSGIRVTGGTVIGGFYGILLSGISGGDYRVDHLRVTGNGLFGIALSSNIGASPPTHAVVDSVEAVNGSGASVNCITLQNVSAGRVAHSSARNCTFGISLYSSRGVIVDDNSVSDSSTGIHLTDSSQDNTITRNTVARNYIGITLINSSINTVNDNHFSGNINYGIRLINGDGNTLVRNTSSGGVGAPGTGIYLQTGSTGNVIEGNIAGGNIDAGINISDAASTGNIYRNNSLSSNGAANNFGTGNQSGGGNCNGTTCS